MKVHNFSAFVVENFNFGILMSSDLLWEDSHSSSVVKPSAAFCHGLAGFIWTTTTAKNPDLYFSWMPWNAAS